MSTILNKYAKDLKLVMECFSIPFEYDSFRSAYNDLATAVCGLMLGRKEKVFSDNPRSFFEELEEEVGGSQDALETVFNAVLDAKAESNSVTKEDLVRVLKGCLLTAQIESVAEANSSEFSGFFMGIVCEKFDLTFSDLEEVLVANPLDEGEYDMIVINHLKELG